MQILFPKTDIFSFIKIVKPSKSCKQMMNENQTLTHAHFHKYNVTHCLLNWIYLQIKAD